MKIITIEEFNKAFNLELEQIPETNKIKFIKNEIKEVEKYIEPKEFSKPDKRLRFANLNLKPNHVFKLSIINNLKNDFINAFQDFNLRHKVAKSENLEKQLVILQACEFGKYYNWLGELLLNDKSLKSKKPTLSHKEKMLVLHYLGLDLSKFENTSIAPILSKVIDFNEANTRIYLSYISAGKNEVRTVKNLEKVAKLFESQNLTDISEKIRKDLEKIKNRL